MMIKSLIYLEICTTRTAKIYAIFLLLYTVFSSIQEYTLVAQTVENKGIFETDVYCCIRFLKVQIPLSPPLEPLESKDFSGFYFALKKEEHFVPLFPQFLQITHS